MQNEYYVPVVKIKADTELGYLLINESEYDKAIHGALLPLDVKKVEPKPSDVDDSMMSEEIVALAKKKFKVKLNPDLPAADLVAAYRDLEKE